jgi:hypothetical protein
VEGDHLILVAASAWAASWELGVGVGAGGDLPGEVSGVQAQSAALPQVGFRLWTDASFATAAMRFTLTGEAAKGHDTLTWWEGEWTSSDDHPAWCVDTGLFAGPSVRLPEGRTVQFIAVAQAGFEGVGFFHDLGGATAGLLDADQQDLDDPDSLDPYTLQAVPAFNAELGVRAGRRVAVEVGLGYTSAWLAAAALQRSPPNTGARRSAVLLNALRLSVGLVAPLGRAAPANPAPTPTPNPAPNPASNP